mgnify:CR=1 FL=1|tara:strand:+ start:1208 stop:3619 length:2412 start_codon:yes stop_codon:yes gene_type:complete
MNVSTNINSPFPNQVVSDAEKATLEYGLQVSRAIEQEWFNYGGAGSNRYAANWNNFHNLRLYARGEQSVQKYKDELAINGDLSYLNLDWKPVPILSKFSNIVANGITQKQYDITSYAQDPESLKKRTDYADNILFDMNTQAEQSMASEMVGVSFKKSALPNAELPQSLEERDLHMQLRYKPAIEIAEEEAINTVLATNEFDLTRARVNQDLVNIGIGITKTTFNPAEGIVVDYVDPAYCVWAYTEDPHFNDIYYVGEVKSITLPELKKEFPNISKEELERIQKSPGNRRMVTGLQNYDSNTVQILYFEYKTYTDQVFKIKKTDSGLEKAIEKTDQFNPPPNDNFDRVSRSIEVLYEGAKVIGTDIMLKWEMSENMTRPLADTTRVEMSYSMCAPRMYKGVIQSLISKCIGFADVIQLTHLKMQQVLARMVPDGVFLDVDGLAEVDLGNGTNYNPQEALNMYFQTGSVVGRSLTQEGDINRGKVPIQELSSSSGIGKMQSLITAYNYNMQMIRDVTGLNEARDGSMPDANALVGLQKMAANTSNTATKHIQNASIQIALSTCENISLKINDVLNFPLTKNSLMNSISTFNVETLKEIENLNLHDFGIFLEMEPDDEERAELQKNIQIALQTKEIDIEDSIDINQIKNLKLANEMLKLKRKKKQEREQALVQQNIQAQAQANAESSEKAAMAEVQKQQALTAEKVAIEQAKSNFEMQRMQTEAQIKKELMATEFQYNLQLAQMKAQETKAKETEIQDRKDQRIEKEGTQQSQLIEQRQTQGLPRDFESAGNDNLGGFDLSQFNPQ